MTPEDIKLLEDNGWSVDCESPFEISSEAGFASGEAADLILRTMRENEGHPEPLTDEMKDEILDYVLPEGSFSKGLLEDTDLVGPAYEEGRVTSDHIYDFLFNCREYLGRAIEEGAV